MPLMIGCPKVGGAGLGLGAAKLAIASKAATEKRVKATKARGLKRPDCEEGFFFMRFSFVSLQRRLSLTIRKLRSDRMPFFSHHSKSAAEIRRWRFTKGSSVNWHRRQTTRAERTTIIKMIL